MCNRDHVWELLFKKRLKKCPSSDDYEKADDLGWKSVLKEKISKQFKSQKKSNFPFPENANNRLSQRWASSITRNSLVQKDFLNNAVNEKNSEAKINKRKETNKHLEPLMDAKDVIKPDLLRRSKINIKDNRITDSKDDFASFAKRNNLENICSAVPTEKIKKNLGKGHQTKNQVCSTTPKKTEAFNKHNFLKNEAVKKTRASAVDLLQSLTRDLQRNKTVSFCKSDINLKQTSDANMKSTAYQK